MAVEGRAKTALAGLPPCFLLQHAIGMRRWLLLWWLGVGLWAGELEARLLSALAVVPRGGDAAVAVWDCRAQRWRARLGDSAPLRLASTTKLLVAAAALLVLGPEFSFVTRVHALGPIAQGGVPGIGVVGGGDPTLDEHFWDGDPERCFRGWAERLRALGIQRIDGDLLIDNRLFQGPLRPPTYPDEGTNLMRWFSAPASAFAYNDNCIDVRAIPEQLDAPCRIEVRPRSPRIRIENRTRAVAAGGDARFDVERHPSANAVSVAGRFSQPTAWFPVAIHEDPDLLAGDALAAALSDAGIALSGSVRLGAVDARRGPLLVEHRSALLPALAVMNQRSQNFYGEQILRLIGVRRYGAGSLSAGTRAVREACQELIGEEAARFTILDGSGLSYGNTGSAEALTRLLAAMDRHRYGRLFESTLRERAGAGVQGRVKTGTLATASCLAGYVEGPRGRLAFAILLGRGQAADWSWGPPLRDRLYELIADAVR